MIFGQGESGIHIDLVDGHRKFDFQWFRLLLLLLLQFTLLAMFLLHDLLQCFLDESFLNLHLIVGTHVSRHHKGRNEHD